MNKKICEDCKREYDPTGKNQRRCKPCGIIREKEYNKEYDKQHYSKNREKIKKHRCSSGHKKHFNLTEDQYNAMFAAQNGSCAICGKHQTTFSRSLAVDHCHQTTTVRGLLCTKCNLMLGLAGENGDDIDILLSAIRYLTLRK